MGLGDPAGALAPELPGGEVLSAVLRVALGRAAAVLPAAHVAALATALAPHGGPGASARRAALGAVAHDGYRAVATGVLDAWDAEKTRPVGGTSPRPAPAGATLAAALETAAEVAAVVRREQRVDVVWTGPSSHAVPVRRTPEVLVDLVREARATLWLVSFAAYRVPLVLAQIAEAADRGVDVRLVLETREDSGGALGADAARAFAPVADLVRFYVWPLGQRPATVSGRSAMHAKGVVVDETAALVTSANLTGQGLADNMELGLLVRGGPVPRRLAAHWRALVDTGALRRVGGP